MDLKLKQKQNRKKDDFSIKLPTEVDILLNKEERRMTLTLNNPRRIDMP